MTPLAHPKQIIAIPERIHYVRKYHVQQDRQRDRRGRASHQQGNDHEANPGVFALLVVVPLLSALLSYAAVMASSGASSDAGAVSIDTTAALGPDSEDPEKLDLAATSIYLLAPLAASLHGVLFAGSELSSGALLNIAVAARRLRTIFAVRALSLVLLSLITGAILTALSIAGLMTGLRQAEVPSLTPRSAPWYRHPGRIHSLRHRCRDRICGSNTAKTVGRRFGCTRSLFRRCRTPVSFNAVRTCFEVVASRFAWKVGSL